MSVSNPLTAEITCVSSLLFVSNPLLPAKIPFKNISVVLSFHTTDTTTGEYKLATKIVLRASIISKILT